MLKFATVTKQQRSVFTGFLMHYGLLSNHPVNVVSQSQLSLYIFIHTGHISKWFVSMHTIEEICTLKDSMIQTMRHPT